MRYIGFTEVEHVKQAEVLGWQEVKMPAVALLVDRPVPKHIRDWCKKHGLKVVRRTKKAKLT